MQNQFRLDISVTASQVFDQPHSRFGEGLHGLPGSACACSAPKSLRRGRCPRHRRAPRSPCAAAALHREHGTYVGSAIKAQAEIDGHSSGSTIAECVFNLVNNVAGAGLLTLSAGMAMGVGYGPAITVALALGAVPVVLKTHTGTHDRLYDALPVVEIGPSTAHPKFDAWTSVTPEFLRGERARIERRARAGGFDVASAYLPYWLGRLFNETLA